MSVKLRFQLSAACLVGLACLTGCEAEPLTPEQESRLERVFADLSDRRAAGVVQNLRYGGLYDGALTRNWSPELASAINQAHYELDFVDENYNFDSEAGMASFLSDLSYASARPRLASELSTDLPAFEQVLAPSGEAIVLEGRCVADGGKYRRGGEQLDLRFWKRRRDAGVVLTWDGWPGGALPMVAVLGSGEDAVPMVAEYNDEFPVTEVRLWQQTGAWVTDAIKHSSSITIDVGDEAGEISLPTGDLYQTGLALERCSTG